MSYANPVPESSELGWRELRETVRHADRTELVKDSVRRMRAADGFSHARSMAFLMGLIFVQAVIALVGLAHALGAGSITDTIVETLDSVVPGAANLLLKDAVQQAQQTGVETASSLLPLVLGTLGALITGTTLLAQIERALNREYGLEHDRPSLQKYGRASVLTLTAGVGTAIAIGLMTFGREVTPGADPTALLVVWNIVRWPLAAVLFAAATAAVFRWSPDRSQPRWTWLMGGAVVAVSVFAVVTGVLNVIFKVSTTFGSTYGPLAGIIALLFWGYGASLSLLLGGAFAAQAEAVRAGVPEPRRERGEPAREAPRLLVPDAAPAART